MTVYNNQMESDIMDVQDKNTSLFGSANGRTTRFDFRVLETLIKRSKLFKYKKMHFFLFSKSGFTKGCTEMAEELGNVTLVRYADIIKNL